MKTAVLRKPYDVALEDREDPAFAEDQFLVKTAVTGISAGTEGCWYNGTNPGFREGRIRYPAVIGYESAGKVVAVGGKVAGIKVGDRVAAQAPHQSLYVLNRAPEGRFVLLPDDMSYEEGLFVSLTALGIHCLHRARPNLGDSFAAVGLGVVGMLFAQVARLGGAGKVIGVDLVEEKLAIAKSLGVEPALNGAREDLARRILDETDGKGVDIAVEATGAAEGVNTCLKVVRSGGKVVILSFHTQPLKDVILGVEFWGKELEMISTRAAGGPDLSHEYTRWNAARNYALAAEYVRKRKVTGRPLITHRFKAENIRDAYQMIDKKKEMFLQVVLEWD